MYYRQLGKCGVEVSVISFGGMRWASEEDAYNTLNHGMDCGMNYVDTSSGYLNGRSEEWIGKAVKDRRDEIYVSTKSNWSKGPSARDVRKAIDDSLKRTGLDYFDFYQIWNLENMETLNDVLKKRGTLEGIRKAMKNGVIRHGLGFTFHGTPEAFKAAVDSGVFVSAMVSYNILKRKEEELIQYAGERGVGVVVMNPLGGGVLALAADSSLSFLRKGDAGPQYGAMRFLLANRHITTSTVGCATPEQVDQALIALEDYESLDETYRLEMIRKADIFRPKEGDFCTGCEYCNKCPEEFRPASLMKAMRDFARYGVSEDRLKEWLLTRFISEKELRKCTECGNCMELCPLHLDILAEIRRAKKEFDI
jgi:predicted aldo/keto reductase-like oxidoreductase